MILLLEFISLSLHLLLFVNLRKKKISFNFFCFISFVKGLSSALILLKHFIHPVQHFYFIDDNIFNEVIIFLNIIYFTLVISYYFFLFTIKDFKNNNLQYFNREIQIKYFNSFVIIFLIYDYFAFSFISITIYNEIFYTLLIPSFFLICVNLKIVDKFIPFLFIVYYFINKTSLCYNYTFIEFLLILFLVLGVLDKLTWIKFGFLTLIIIFSFYSKDLLKERVKIISCSVGEKYIERKISVETKVFLDEIKKDSFQKLLTEKTKEYLQKDSGNKYKFYNVFNERLTMRYNSPNHALSAVMYDDNELVIAEYKKYFILKIFPTFISKKFHNMENFTQNKFGRDIGLIDSKDIISALTIPNITYLYMVGGKLFVILVFFLIPLVFVIHQKLKTYFKIKNIGIHIVNNSLIFLTYNLIGSIEQGNVFDIAKKYLVFIIIFLLITKKIKRIKTKS